MIQLFLLDGKIYQLLHGHDLSFAADSLSKYLLNVGDFRKEIIEYTKSLVFFL